MDPTSISGICPYSWWGLPSQDPTEPCMHGCQLCVRVSLVAQMVKSLPAVWETWVWPLGQEDPLEKEMATHSSILAWEISWTEEPGRLQSMGSQRVGHDWATSFTEAEKQNPSRADPSFSLHCVCWLCMPHLWVKAGVPITGHVTWHLWISGRR